MKEKDTLSSLLSPGQFQARPFEMSDSLSGLLRGTGEKREREGEREVERERGKKRERATPLPSSMSHISSFSDVN